MRLVTASLLVCLSAGLPLPHASAADDSDKAKLAQKALGILEKNCAQCHGPASKGEGGFNIVLDVQKMIESGGVKDYLIPGNADKSYMFQRVRDGEMPPDSKKVTSRPTDDDIKLLKEWIVAGAPAVASAADIAKRTFITPADMLDLMDKDLTAMRRDKDRLNTRYFILTNLYNAGVPDDQLDIYRVGLSMLVNSLSYHADITPPHPIDDARTIYRIDLRDYDWTPDTWNLILTNYPYGIKRAETAAQDVYTQTGSDMPYVHADWFVFNASRPPLYYDLLKIPATVQELEATLHVNVTANIDNEKFVARAAFNGSGVSQNNRLLERHPLGTTKGAYYRSRDFASSVGKKNLFAHPLDFVEDGGEIIFSLPNGLQAYMLVKGTGERIEKGPVNIVFDKTSRNDPQVINGVSCMSCHDQGMIPKVDQVRPYLEKNKNVFDQDTRDTILALYKPKEEFSEFLRKDGERFRSAAHEAGVPLLDNGKLKSPQPIREFAFFFEGEVGPAQAAAELGLKEDDFLKLLEDNPTLAGEEGGLGTLRVAGGTVKREAFDDKFADLVKAAGVGTVFGGVGDTAQSLVEKGNTLRSNNDVDGALDAYTKAADKDPNNLAAQQGRGDLLFAKEKYTDAIDVYTKAIDLDANDVVSIGNRGLSKFRNGDKDAALVDLNKAIELLSGVGAVYEARGDIRLESKDFSGAIDDFQAAVDKDALNTAASDKLTKALTTRGQDFLDNGKYTEAIADFKKAHDLAPTDEDIAADLARGLHSRGQDSLDNQKFAEAIEDLKQAHDLAPKDTAIGFSLGLAHKGNGDKQEAIDDFTDVIKLDDKNSPAFEMRAKVEADLEKYTDAIDDLKACVDIEPNNAGLIAELGEAYLLNGSYDESIEQATKAIGIDADSAYAYRVRGRAYLKRNNDGDAALGQADLDKAAELEKDK